MTSGAAEKKRKELRSGPSYRCQFCAYVGRGWDDDGYKCPRCGREYDAILAQDSEE